MRQAFKGFLLRRIAENVTLVHENGTEVKGQDLIRILGALVRFFDSLKKLTRRGYSAKFIRFLVLNGATEKAQFKDRQFMSGLFERLQQGGFSVRDMEWRRKTAITNLL